MSKKKIIIWNSIFAILILIVIYICIAITPYIRTNAVTKEYVNSLDVQKFYRDSINPLEQVMMLDDCNASFVHRLNIIEKAEREILFTSYATHYGETTKLFFASLLKAADKGVKVKIILDAKFSGMTGKGEEIKNMLIAHDNIELYLFNEINLFKPQDLNISFHDKFLVVDNKYLIFGGRNVGDKYYNPESFTKNLSLDREVLIYNKEPFANSAIQQVKEYFSDVLEASLCNHKDKLSNKKNKKAQKLKMIYLENYEIFLSEKPEIGTLEYDHLTPVNKITLITNPLEGRKKEPWLYYNLYLLAKNSEKMLIQSPYTILSKSNFKLLADICATTDVTLLTNSLASTPNLPAFSNYYFNRQNYLDLGLKIYEYQATTSSIHAKTILFDERLVVVGSFNFDERSIHLDTESMLVIDSPEFYQEAIEVLNLYLNQSIEVGVNNEYIIENVKPLPVSWLKKTVYRAVGSLGELIKFLL